MAAADIQNPKVAKKMPIEAEFYAYLAGAVYMSDPVALFDPPRRIPDAKGSLSNDELEKLAAKRQPPKSWYEGEEEKLF